MTTLSGFTMRCAVECKDFTNPFKAVDGKTLAFPAGVDATFQLAFFDSTELVSIANFDTVTLKVYNQTRTLGPYMSATLNSGDLDASLTTETWEDGTKQHAEFTFTAAETELGGTIAGTEYYLLVVVKDSGSKILTQAWTRFLVIFDEPDPETAVQPGNIVPGGATYDGSGEYTLAVTSGVYYKWTQGANDTNLENPNGGTVVSVSDSNFAAASTSVMLNGTPSVAVTAIVRRSPYLTADEVAALITSVTLDALGGVGSPEGVVTASPYQRYTEDDGAGEIAKEWVKMSGVSTNTGWK